MRGPHPFPQEDTITDRARNLADNLAGFIRQADNNNRLPAPVLGGRIAEYLTAVGYPANTAAVTTYVDDINRDKTMGASMLADKIVERFDLAR